MQIVPREAWKQRKQQRVSTSNWFRPGAPRQRVHDVNYERFSQYKKVLLRERKRHTARRVTTAISCYSVGGGGGGGGGFLDKNFFFQSEHVSSQIWCQKIFPLIGGGGSLHKIFFFQSEHVSSQIWCQKFFPLLRLGPTPRNLSPGSPPRKSETWDPPWKSDTWYPPKIWHLGPPLKIWDLGTPPPSRLDQVPAPPKMWTDWNYYLPPSFGWRAVITDVPDVNESTTWNAAEIARLVHADSEANSCPIWHRGEHFDVLYNEERIIRWFVNLLLYVSIGSGGHRWVFSSRYWQFYVKYWVVDLVVSWEPQIYVCSSKRSFDNHRAGSSIKSD